MDFSLSEEQKMVQRLARDLALKEIAPLAAEIDEACRYPAEIVARLGELGLMGIPFPEDCDGGGGGPMDFVLVIEELSRVSASVGVIYAVSSGLAGKVMYLYGDTTQRQRWVAPLARGEKLACFALTEANAGSDAAALETRAVRTADGYRLTGSKIFITNGAEADTALVFATMDASLGHRGITAFLVATDSPGFSVGKLQHKMGIRATSTAELVFEDCFVPFENRLGEEGQGFNIAMKSLDSGRISIAAQAIGIAQGAFDAALAYAAERVQFGQPIVKFQAIQWLLADMATRIEAARLLTHQAATLEAGGAEVVKLASMAKLTASDTANSVTSQAIQILGGYGYTTDYPLERYYRDARVTSIYEGTDEIQRLTIARCLTKEPPRP